MDEALEALLLRAKAVHELVDDGQLDGVLGLSLVIDPSPELEQWSRQVGTRRRWTDAHRHRAAALAAQGLTQREIAIQVCGSAKYRSTVATWLKQPTA